MILNTQQLQYLVEIEQAGSISQAATNLYMGQPNLSRLLRETETTLGFPIFERTRQGVRPTERGKQFLLRARNILREAAYMEQLGPNSTVPNQFRICIPHSYAFLNIVQQYLNRLPPSVDLDAFVQECHPQKALELLDNSTVAFAVVRFASELRGYWEEQAVLRKLTFLPFSQGEYQIIISKDNPLQGRSILSNADLEGLTEITHADTFSPATQIDISQNKLYTKDRMAQLQLLVGLPYAYLRSEPLPKHILDSHGLSQHPCSDSGARYQNALIFNPQCTMSEIETAFLDYLKQESSSKTV